jgi:hypothetical protein
LDLLQFLREGESMTPPPHQRIKKAANHVSSGPQTDCGGAARPLGQLESRSA